MKAPWLMLLGLSLPGMAFPASPSPGRAEQAQLDECVDRVAHSLGGGSVPRCYATATESAMTRMKAALVALESRLEPAAFEKVAAAQSAWSAFREKNQVATSAVMRRGPEVVDLEVGAGREVVRSMQDYELVRQRADELERMLAEITGD